MKNRTVLITGGGGLLGPQHGIALASEGINIVLIDKIPRNDSGKIQYSALN